MTKETDWLLIGAKGAKIQSLSEAIDTATPGGRLVFHMLGSLAEFERSLIAERTREGMKAAKRRGRHVGRPRLLDQHKVANARHLIDTRQETPEARRRFLMSASRPCAERYARQGPSTGAA